MRCGAWARLGPCRERARRRFGSPGATVAQSLRRSRALTERLCEALATEDYVVQSMPDASPAKWHLAHTTWFFETFVLGAHARGYRPHREHWGYLHNSYYEALGPRFPRPRRGMLTRPTVGEVYEYRAVVDRAVQSFLSDGDPSTSALDVLELGLHHEQQHQELLLTDLQHALAENPLRPALHALKIPDKGAPTPLGWSALHRSHGRARYRRSRGARGFAFDNEEPQHRVHTEPFDLASRLVTSGEFAEFIADDGYGRPELWLSDGWAAVRNEGWAAPLYWERRDDTWERYSLHGMMPVDPEAPVCHVSFYEADAYARWAGARLPTEFEWEIVARDRTDGGQFVEDGAFVPVAERARDALLGGAWAWTASPYVAYPGFEPAKGAVGEYNGKFMVNQIVLRGGSCFTSRSHIRSTYRNFFPPSARWQVSGIRLCKSTSTRVACAR